MEKLINELEEKGIDYTAEITNFQGVLIYINEDISIQEWGKDTRFKFMVKMACMRTCLSNA